MIDVALVFAVTAAMFLAVGGGWATLLRAGRQSLTAWAFWAFAIGLATESVAWSWALGLGGGLSAALSLSCLGAATGWAFALRAGTSRPLREGAPTNLSGVEIAALLVVAVVMITPGLSGLDRTTLAYRIGPDAIGNAVGAQALANGHSLPSLESELLTATGARTLTAALDQHTRVLYAVPSMRTQMRTEFLIAGLRWGFSGAAAIPLRLCGPSRVWAVVTLLPILSALFAALGMVSLLSACGTPPWKRSVAVIVSLLGVTLLNGYREGGLAQLWVAPCLVAFAWATLDEKAEKRERAQMAAIGLAGLLPAYSDAAFVLAAVTATMLCLAALLRERQQVIDYTWLSVGAAAGVAMTGPFAVRFISYIPRRLKDAQIGGWSMPRWTSPSETLGLFNSYDQRFAGLVARSHLVQFEVTACDLVLVGLTIAALVVLIKHRTSVLLVATTLVIAVFYVKSRHLNHVTNYQYFKAAGISQPLLGLSLVLLWHHAGLQRETLRRALTALTACVGLACAIVSIEYTAGFMSGGRTLDPRLVTALCDPATRDLINARNLVAPMTLETLAMVPDLPVYWFGRPAFEIEQRSQGRTTHILSLVLIEDDCKQWGCIRSVPPARVHAIGPTLRLIDLGPTDLSTQPTPGPSPLPDVVSSRLTALGGPAIGRTYHPATHTP